MQSLGAVHAILTAASRAERATLRAAREMARRQAEHDPLARTDIDDGLAINKQGLERLTACHRADYRKIDWRDLAARELVALPVRAHEREKAARRALATWQPSWQDRMFGDEAQRRRQLTAKVLEAAREDEIVFQKAYRAAEAYNAETWIARRLFELDPKAIKEAVALKTRLAELREGMNALGVALPGGGRLVAVVDAIQEGDVPHERVGEGDLRHRKRELIPLPDRRQIHLAAVCSVALRVGADLVALMPLEAVEVVVCCETAEGGSRSEPKPVLQLLVTAKALSDPEWKKGDPVSLATSLGARMDWSIEQGFAPIRLVALSAMGRPLAA